MAGAKALWWGGAGLFLGQKEGLCGWRRAIKSGKRLGSQTRATWAAPHTVLGLGAAKAGGQLGSALASPSPQHHLFLGRTCDVVEGHAWTLASPPGLQSLPRHSPAV